jgi:hypothetical protein
MRHCIRLGLTALICWHVWGAAPWSVALSITLLSLNAELDNYMMTRTLRRLKKLDGEAF